MAVNAPQEDAKLAQLVLTYGPCNWSLIAAVRPQSTRLAPEPLLSHPHATWSMPLQTLGTIPPRNGKSCRLRWELLKNCCLGVPHNPR